MRKVKLIVHETYQGKRKSEDVFAAVFLSNAAALTPNTHSGIILDVGDMVIDGVIGAIAGAVGGSGMGKSVNIKTLNKNLTKKFFSHSFDVAKKGVKYYVSQTRTVYRKFLFDPLIDSGSAALLGNNAKSIHSVFMR